MIDIRSVGLLLKLLFSCSLQLFIMAYTGFIAATLLVSSAYAQWTPSPLCPFPSEELTRFQYEGDCSKYWECYEGARYPMDCPSGLEYSAAESRCDSPDVANCDPDATIVYPTFSHSTQTTPSQGPTSDPGPRPECPFPSDVITFYPVVNNCSQYWECYQGNRYLMSCPGGQYWSDSAQTCDYSYNVPCNADNNSTTTAKPTTSPGTDTTKTSTPGTDTTKTTGTTATIPTSTGNPYDVLCKDKADGTYIPDPDDCHKFFECVSHKVIEGTCPNDLVWNEAALTCDFPSNVQCNTLKFH